MKPKFDFTYSLTAALLISACPVWSADVDPQATWKKKPAADWTEKDARQVLENSPWAKRVATELTRLQSEAERRDSGQMGRPHGVGYDNIEDPNKRAKSALGPVFLPARSKDGLGAIGTVVLLRWETALPVRVAELKTNTMEPPTLAEDGYVLAVYGVPGKFFNARPETLGEPLRKVAVLKREGKKDIRPIRVEVFQRDTDMVIAYTFSNKDEITKNDKFVQFDAQIGRFIIVQDFDLEAMKFDGKLEM